MFAKLRRVAAPPLPASPHDLRCLVAHSWLVPGALVVVERPSRGPALEWPDGLRGERAKRYGETVLWYGHAT